MSILTYNGITLPYSFTTNFSQEAVYDESDTDWTCTKFDIRVQAVLNIDYIAVIASKYTNLTSPDNAAAIMKAIRSDLLKPRRTLSFKFNDVELIPANTVTPGTVDVKNGPKPQSCVVTQLNNTTFLIVYHIIAHYWENNEEGAELAVTNKPGHPALWNRWSETVEIDNLMSTRRVREGKYIIRTDNTQGKTADELRSQLAVIGVPTGFVRESSRYTISPDGLGLQYSISDKQVFKKYPPGAYEADGRYTESTDMNGVRRFGEVIVTLKGPPDNFIVDQADLLRTAITIGVVKLNQRGTDKVVCQYSSATVEMYENKVNFTARYQLESVNARIKGLAAYTGDMCNTPGTDDNPDNPGPVYLDRGAFGLILQAAKYWDPSIPDTQLAPDNIVDPEKTKTTKDNVQHNHGVKVGRAGVELEA